MLRPLCPSQTSSLVSRSRLQPKVGIEYPTRHTIFSQYFKGREAKRTRTSSISVISSDADTARSEVESNPGTSSSRVSDSEAFVLSDDEQIVQTKAKGRASVKRKSSSSRASTDDDSDDGFVVSDDEMDDAPKAKSKHSEKGKSKAGITAKVTRVLLV